MKRPGSQGFTIIELLVAIVVGVTFVVGVNELMSTYVRIGVRSRELVAANSYVEAKVESLRSAGYNALSIGTTDISGELPSELLPPRSGSLQVSNPSTGIKKVDISVTYKDNGEPRTYSYTTYIGELGVGQ